MDKISLNKDDYGHENAYRSIEYLPFIIQGTVNNNLGSGTKAVDAIADNQPFD